MGQFVLTGDVGNFQISKNRISCPECHLRCRDKIIALICSSRLFLAMIENVELSEESF